MRVDLRAVRLDFGAFVGENKGKLLIGALLIALFAVLGVVGAFQGTPEQTFDESRHYFIRFIRNEKNIGYCAGMFLLEMLPLLLLCLLLAQHGILRFGMYGVLAYKSHSGFRIVFIIIRCVGFRAILFFVFQFLLLLLMLFVLLSYVVRLIGARDMICRDRKDALILSVPFYIAIAATLVLQLLFLVIFAGWL